MAAPEPEGKDPLRIALSISQKPRRLWMSLAPFAPSSGRGKDSIDSGAAKLVAALLVALALGLMLMVPAASAASSLLESPSAVDVGTRPAPTIQSDKSDYPPGATVLLTGTDWSVNETVKISVNDEEGQSWSLTDYVSPDSAGNITDRFQL